MSTVPPMVRQREIVEEMARNLVAEAPEGWERIEEPFHALGRMMEDETWVTFADGRRESVAGPWDNADLAEELRTVMYRPGVGTWFSFTLAVTSSGSVDATFDHENEPEWFGPPPVPSFYDFELRQFHRDPEHIPAWFPEGATGE